MISFIQSSDWHYDKETQDHVAKSLDVLLVAGSEKLIDFWAFPGDLANRAIAASDAGGLNRLKDYIQRMLDIAPIVAVEGTMTHDHPGFYRVFEDMVGKGGARFFLVTPEHPCFLDAKEGTLGRCMILGCPEPRRSELLAGHEGSRSLGRVESCIPTSTTAWALTRQTAPGAHTRSMHQTKLDCTIHLG